MATIFADLCTFFGIAGVPQNMSELLPWLIQILFAVGLVGAVFNLFKDWGGIIISGGKVGRR